MGAGECRVADNQIEGYVRDLYGERQEVSKEIESGIRKLDLLIVGAL